MIFATNCGDDPPSISSGDAIIKQAGSKVWRTYHDALAHLISKEQIDDLCIYRLEADWYEDCTAVVDTEWRVLKSPSQVTWSCRR